jgi:hypothetical protein
MPLLNTFSYRVFKPTGWYPVIWLLLQSDVDGTIERVLDHLNLFAVVMWFLGSYYCKSLDLKSTELWQNLIMQGKKRDQPPGEKPNRSSQRISHGCCEVLQ